MKTEGMESFPGLADRFVEETTELRTDVESTISADPPEAAH